METFAHLQDAIRAIIPADAINRMRLNAMQRHQKGYDPMPVVRLYVPFTCCQWLLTEIDEDLDTAFGLCDLGMGFPEVGPVSLYEIAEVTPHVRCDPHFVAVAPLSVYSREARNAQGIVLAWEGVPLVEPEDVPTVDELYASFEEDAAGTGAFDNTGCANTGSAEELNQTETLPLAHFLDQFRQPLLEQIEKQTPVVYDGQRAAWQDDILAGLKRTPFPAQAHRIHAVYAGLVERDLPAVFLNGEMGTGKTMMGICLAALMYRGYSQKPVLVISPPHLVYKWRREILDTIPQAAVTVINGSNAIIDLIRFRERLVDGRLEDGRQHFLVIGRVRMRMGFYWKPAYWKRPYRYLVKSDEGKRAASYEAIACPCCGSYQTNREGVPTMAMPEWGSERREYCQNKECAAPLWTMRHKGEEEQSAETRLRGFLKQLPGIGKVTANRLIDTFGVENLSKIIDNNIYDFVNLQKGDGDFMFGDKHAQRLEKALGRLEFALQMVSYQPSEYVKRHFPRKAFSLALVDEAHEYKNQGSAQGQAMAVLCNESEKVVCLTGTLMGGYASDLFHLLFRAMPGVMSRMGYAANRHNSFAAAEERFMRTYGCLIDVYSVNDEGSHLTAKGKKTSMHTKKAPGFSSPGIARFMLGNGGLRLLHESGHGCYGHGNVVLDVQPLGSLRQRNALANLPQRLRLRDAVCHGGIQQQFFFQRGFQQGMQACLRVIGIAEGGMFKQHMPRRSANEGNAHFAKVLSHQLQGVAMHHLKAGQAGVQSLARQSQQIDCGLQRGHSRPHGGLQGRQRKQLERGGRDDAQRAFAADQQMAQVVAGIVFAQAVQAVPDPALRRNGLQPQAQLACIAVAQHLRAARIACQVAAYGATAFAAHAQRIQPACIGRSLLHLLQRAARFGREGLVGAIHSANAVQALQAHDHAGALTSGPGIQFAVWGDGGRGVCVGVCAGVGVGGGAGDGCGPAHQARIAALRHHGHAGGSA